MASNSFYLHSALSFLMLCLENSTLSLSRPSAPSPQIRAFVRLSQGSPSSYRILENVPVESCDTRRLTHFVPYLSKTTHFYCEMSTVLHILFSLLLTLGGRRYSDPILHLCQEQKSQSEFTLMLNQMNLRHREKGLALLGI